MIETISGPAAGLFAAGSTILLVGLIWLARKQGFGLHVMVLGLTFFHQSSLIVFPVLYDWISGFALEKEMVVDVGPQLLSKVMLGEFIYVAAFSFPIFLSLRRRRVSRPLAQSAAKAEAIYAQILMLLGLIIFAVQFYSTPVIEYESYKHFAEAKTYDNILGLVGAWIKGAFALPCLFAACLLVSDLRQRRAIKYAAFGIIFLMLLFGVATGYRGRITWVVSLLFVGAIINRNRFVLLCGAGMLVLTAVFAQFMGGVWRSISINDLAGQSQWTAITRLAQEASGGDSMQDEKSDLIKVLARRAQGPRNSAVLYQLQDAHKGAGVRPILSSIETIVPRSLWPEKGIGGSSDETPYGAAIFLVRYIGYDAPLFNMGPVLASAHAYWEGGWLWLVLGGVIAGIFWSGVLSFAYRLPPLIGRIVCLAYTSSLLIDGLFTIFNPLYTFILATINLVAFVYASYLGVRLFCRIKGTPLAVRIGGTDYEKSDSYQPTQVLPPSRVGTSVAH